MLVIFFFFVRSKSYYFQDLLTASHGLEYCISDLPITLSHGREGHKAHMDISCLESGKNTF